MPSRMRLAQVSGRGYSSRYPIIHEPRCGKAEAMMDKWYYGLHRLDNILMFVNLTVGLLLGLSCTIGGLTLIIFGAVSHTSWTVSLFGLSSSVNDITPGVLLFIA